MYNPGLCERVITCMSKRALVYASKIATVLSRSGLPVNIQLQTPASQGYVFK